MRTWLNRLTPLCLLLSLVAPVSSLAETADAGTVQVELTGLQNASGNIYIAVYDSDDTWLPDKLDKQIRLIADHRELALVFSDVELFDNRGTYCASYLGQKAVASRLCSQRRVLREAVLDRCRQRCWCNEKRYPLFCRSCMPTWVRPR